MISDPIAAKRVNELLLEAFYRLDESCAVVRDSSPAEEYVAYIKSTARIAGGILETLEHVYKRQPQLKPANWDEE